MKVSLVSITSPVITDPRDGKRLSAEELITYCARVSSPQNQLNLDTAPKLLGYCIRNRHWSIFEMVSMTVEIETSRVISQQITRHRSFSYQEFSQRYAPVGKLGGSLFEPVELRLKNPAGNRQGSIVAESMPTIEWNGIQTKADAVVADFLAEAEGLYGSLLEAGFAPESARMILPLCTKTKLYMTGPLRSWIHYLAVRCDSHAQLEHREVAYEIRKIFTEQFPNVAQALADRDDLTCAARKAYESWASTGQGNPPRWDDLAPEEMFRWLAVASTVGIQA